MHIHRAILTAAGTQHRTLPLQTLVDRDGKSKTILHILLDGLAHGGIDEVCLVVRDGDQDDFLAAAGPHQNKIRFAVQPESLGSGHAVWCAREFAKGGPFLVLFCDHLHLWSPEANSIRQVIEAAAANACCVFAVKPTHESQLRHYGIVGGRLVPGPGPLYEVSLIREKPSPTHAEQHLAVPGLRHGYYLGFFGIHALSSKVMEELDARVAKKQFPVVLSDAMGAVCGREKCLALEMMAERIDLGEKYGILRAQLALGMAGADREEILSIMVGAR